MTAPARPRVAGRLRNALFALLFAALCTACASGPSPRPRDPYALTLRATSGEFVELGRFRGQVVLLTFFATWCFPCMVEVPHLQALQQEFSPRGFSVVAIGMDLEGAKVLRPFAATLEPAYPVLVADDEVREGRSPYGTIRELPTSYLLDRNGQVVAGFSGSVDPQQLRKLIDRLTR